MVGHNVRTLDGYKTTEDSTMSMVLENKHPFGHLELQKELKRKGCLLLSFRRTNDVKDTRDIPSYARQFITQLSKVVFQGNTYLRYLLIVYCL